jgi:hypothetical protein
MHMNSIFLEILGINKVYFYMILEVKLKNAIEDAYEYHF